MTDLLAGEIVGVALLVIGVVCLLGLSRRNVVQQPDAGLDVFETPAPAPYTSPSDRSRPDAWTGNAADECNVAAQGQVHDCDGDCGECGEFMVIHEGEKEPRPVLPGDPVQRMLALGAAGEPYVEYGSAAVHQSCLADRRDNRAVCARCAPVMGVAR